MNSDRCYQYIGGTGIWRRSTFLALCVVMSQCLVGGAIVIYVAESKMLNHHSVQTTLEQHWYCSSHVLNSTPPRVHSDSHPLSQWCHPAISSSVIPFSSCSQSLPASESFPLSQLFAWGGQSTGVSGLAPSLPKKSQGWSPSEWTGWISLQSNSPESSPTPQFKSINSSALSLLHSPTLTFIHDHRKNHSLD